MEIGENCFISILVVVGVDLYCGFINENIEEVGLSYVMFIQNGVFVLSLFLVVMELGIILEYYNYFSGCWCDGQLLFDEGFGYESGLFVLIVFIGDFVVGIGWMEVGEGNFVNDCKVIFLAGFL